MMEWWKNGMLGEKELDQLENSLSAFTFQYSIIPAEDLF
jgi:hypothetical protein